MNRRLLSIAAYLQLGLTVLGSIGCAPTQPFFLNESPNLQYYLDQATAIEYPDVEVASLAETTEALAPLAIGNHEFEYWDLTLEECVSIALQNSKFFRTVDGTAEFRQNVAAQFVSGTPAQFGSVYDLAIQQTTTQSIPLTVDGNGNRVLPRGVTRANQIGGVEDALAEFDAQLSSFVNFNTTDRVRNVGPNNPFNPQQFQANDNTQQIALSKRMATGGVVTLREQIIYSRNNVQAGGVGRQTPSDYTAILEAQIQHPLMRNRGTLINRIPVVLASLNEDTSLAQFENQLRNLVRDVEVAYWDLYTAYRNVETAMVGRNSAQATAQFATSMLEEGVGTAQDVAQAQEQYYQFRGQLESALAGANLPGSDRLGVYGAERTLREKLGLAATDGRLIRPIDEPTIAEVQFDWHEAVAEMLYLSPDLRRTKVEIKKRELELMQAKNQLLPEVNLSLLYRWVGVGDTLGPPSGSDVRAPLAGSSALGELTSGDYQEAGVRLEILPPAFGARRELARVQNAKIQLARDVEFLKDQELMAVSMLSDAVGKLKTHYQMIQTFAQRLAAAEEEVNTRLALYKGGREPANVVLQSQLRRAQAQISYYQALTEYNKSINYVHYLKGSLLQTNNIALAEGPWPHKAYWDALERARERSAGKKMNYGWTRPAVVRRGAVQPSHGDAAAIEGLPGGAMLPGHGGQGQGEFWDAQPGTFDGQPELIAPGEAVILDAPIGSGVPARSPDAPQQSPAADPQSTPQAGGGGAATEPAFRRAAGGMQLVEPAVHVEGVAPQPVPRRPLP